MKKNILFFLCITAVYTCTPMDVLENCTALFVTAIYKIKYPSLTVIETLPKKQRDIVCHDYAFLKIIDKVGQFPRIGEEWHTKYKVLEQFFVEVTDQQPDDIVIYKDHEKGSTVLHTGIVSQDISFVISKWGRCPNIYLHKVRDVPEFFRRNISYYRMNKSKEELYDYIKKQEERIVRSPSKRVAYPLMLRPEEIKLCVLTVMIIGLWIYIR